MSDLNKKFEETASPYLNLVKGAITLIPTGIGLYAGYQQILSNNPISLAGMGQDPASTTMGLKVGRKLKTSLSQTKGKRAAQSKKLAEQLGKIEEIDKIWGEVEQRNVLVQSLISTIEDPSNALDDHTTKTLKEGLHKLITNDEKFRESADSLKTVKDAISTIVNSGNPKMMAQFNSYRDEFKHLGPQLVPISTRQKSNIAFEEIPDGNYSDKAKHIRDMLGKGYDVRIARISERGGETGVYARIYQGNRWKANVPIDLSQAQLHMQGAGTAPIVRMGEHGETAYIASRRYGWAPSILAAKNKGNLSNITPHLETPEQMSLRLLETAHREGTLDRSYNSYLREIMVTRHRGAGVMGNLPSNPADPAAVLGRHLNANQAFNAMEFKVLGLDKLSRSEQEEFPRIFLQKNADGKFVPMSGLDPGIVGDAMMKRDKEGRISSSVALAKESSVAHFKATSTYTGMDPARVAGARFTLPITARESQVVGREHVLWDQGINRGIGKSFQRGIGAANVDWSEALTGASNRAVLLEVGSNRLGLDSMGEAFTTRGGKVIEHFTKPILDPAEMGQFGTQLVRDVQAAGDQGLNLTRQQIQQQYGGFVGIGPAGNQFIPNNPNLESMRLFMSEAADPVSGQKKMHISGAMVVNIEEGQKYFSMLFKGSQKLIDSDALEHALDKFGMTTADLIGMGINPQDLILTTGDMLKKGPDVLLSQMISGLGVLKKSQDPFEHVYGLERHANNVFGDHKVGRVTDVVMNELSKHSPDMKTARDFTNAGRVLAGIYEYGGEMGDFNIAQNKTDAKALLEQEVIKRFGGRSVDIGSGNMEDAASLVTRGMKGGLALGATSVMAGPQPGDIKAARASIEIRTLKNLQQKLRMMNADENLISDVLSDFLSRKEGIEAQTNLLPSLVRMQGSVLGQNMPLDSIKGKATPMTLEEFFSQYVGGQKSFDAENFQEILKKHQGINLDFSQTKTPQGEVLANMAKRVFGTTELYIPGGDVLDEMRSSVIRSTEGDIRTLPEFSKNTAQLFSFVQKAMSNSNLDSGEVEKQFKQYRESTNRFALNVLDNLGRGKIKGSQFMLGASYDLNNSIYLNEAQRTVAKKIMGKTGGNAAFMTGRGFLSSLGDFMGSGVGNRRDTGQKLQSFFLGQEGNRDFSTMKGVSVLTNRHPNLSPGHLMGLQIFRHVKETGVRGADDESWQILTKSKKVQDILAADFQGVTGWGDLARATEGRRVRGKLVKGKNGKMRLTKIVGDRKMATKTRRLFEAMAGGLKENAPEGGGILFFPQIKGKIKWGSGSDELDISLNAPAIGDFDGDTFGIFHLNNQLGSALTKQMSGKNSQFLAEDLRYRTSSAVFMAEAKKSMKLHLGTGGTEGRIWHDVAKERSVKGSTPPLEIKMNMLRTSLMNFGETLSGREQVNTALALLTTLTEFASIKAKKLAEHKGWPEQLIAGVDELFATGDAGSFKRVITDEIMKGSEVFSTAGVQVTSAEADQMAFIKKQFTEFNINGRNILDLIEQSALAQRAALEGNLQNLESVGQTMMALGEGNTELSGAVWRNLFLAGGNLQAAVAKGAVEGADLELVQTLIHQQKKIMNAASRSSKFAVAPVIAGMIGSMVLSQVMGGTDYGAEPLLMPGESVSPQVQSAMASGNLFNYQEPHGDRVESNPMMNRVINPGTTYLEQPNSYQVRSEINETSGLRNLTSYISSVSRGRSSIVINDTRRPISSVYMDEITGE